MKRPALVVRDTLRALVRPERIVPILVVSIPLLWAQGTYSKDARALPLGVLMCLTFVLCGPVLWRVLVGEGRPRRHLPGRLALYALLGLAAVYTVGAAIPRTINMGETFLTTRVNLAVCAALFLVGGWGLGRDIGLEANLVRERARAELLSREAERAQLLALRSHLDPHFLFNTLNAIAEWCREDGAVAERAVLQLSAILRAVLAGVRASSWPVQKELELVDTLLALHLLRDDSLFSLRREIPADLGPIPVPPLVLLPLVENAIKHGPCAGHRGEVFLRMSRRDDELHIMLSNPGSYLGPREGSEGVPTVEKRLQLAYDGRARFTIRGDGERTVVEVSVPAAGVSSQEPT